MRSAGSTLIFLWAVLLKAVQKSLLIGFTLIKISQMIEALVCNVNFFDDE